MLLQLDVASSEILGRDSLWQLQPLPYPTATKHWQRLAPGDIPPIARPPASSEGAASLSARVQGLREGGGAATPRGAPPSGSFSAAGGDAGRRSSAVERSNTLRGGSAPGLQGEDAALPDATGGYGMPATFKISEGRPRQDVQQS